MFAGLARKLGILDHRKTQDLSDSIELSSIEGEKNVIIVTGWAGAGKTSLIRGLVSRLGSQLPKLAGIINEQSNSGSINVDLGRLPPGFDKIGMAGCICCVGIKQVKEALTKFHSEGKLLTLLEQSPLSNTSDLRRAVDRHAFSPFIIAVLKPSQLVPRYSAEQVRSADAVVIAGQINPETKRILKELTADLAYPPHIFEMDGTKVNFPNQLWDLANKPRDKKVAESRSSSSAISEASEITRRLDVSHFTELQIVPYPLRQGESLEDRAKILVQALESLRNSTGDKIEILRVKGIFAGQDFDITRTSVGLEFSIESRDYPRSDVSPGQDYLYLRSLDSRLKTCWEGLFESVGTPICSPEVVQSVTALYPTKADLYASLRQENQLCGVFEADSLLWELGDSLEYFQSIADLERQQTLGQAIVELTRRFLQSRLDVLEILQTKEAKSLPKYNSILFDTLFIGARILVHPQIRTLFEIDSGQEELRNMSLEFWKFDPVTNMLKALTELENPTINGSHDLTNNDLAWFDLFIKEEKARQALTQDIRFAQVVETTYTEVMKNAQGSRNDAWLSYAPLIRQAFGLS